MPRTPRPVADGLLYHPINRGNNRAAVFFQPEDYLTFLKALRQVFATQGIIGGAAVAYWIDQNW